MAKDMKNSGAENTAEKKSKSSKFRFSVADISIMAIIFLSLVGIVYRTVFFNDKSLDSINHGDGKMYVVKYTVEEVHEDAVKTIKADDEVFLSSTGDFIGHIASMNDFGSAAIMAEPIPDSELEDKEGEMPRGDSKKVRITEGHIIASDVIGRDGGLYVPDSGLYLAPGSVVSVFTKTAVMEIRITYCEVIE